MTTDWLKDLTTILSDGALREVGDTYLTEPRGMWRGSAAAVVAPSDTEEVARVIRFAASRGIPVVPWSGGTGLVGGQTMPDAMPILLSTERMNRIREVYPSENVLVAEAGCILTDVHGAAADADRLFPLSLASEGTARIGGLLATNAGGVQVLRYGNARDLVLGIEAVLPSGEILRGLRRLRKDNTGYDLRNLLIGAEGTLGVITAAALRLFPRPAHEGTAVLVVESPAKALDLLGRALKLGGVTAFELMAGQGMQFLQETGVPVRLPFPEAPEWSVLIDLGLGPEDDPIERLERLFVEGHETGLVSDGVIASSEAQRRDLWAVRETIPEANKRIGAIASNDISLPLSAVPDFIDGCGARLRQAADLRINCFGHLGDGNLHYNLFPAEGRSRADYTDRVAELREIVAHEVAARDGSFSAEHGVGRLKVAELERYGDPAKMQAMRAIKAALDPAGIMNPGAVLRAPSR
ncbi:FAD-binding oxidoreductase [Palleronia sp.]|uniref:FAD-binding oxidoreductase n=1 Tax=Palleronia sp. TaxID=1940284 RepID=UPI0035C8113F